MATQTPRRRAGGQSTTPNTRARRRTTTPAPESEPITRRSPPGDWLGLIDAAAEYPLSQTTLRRRALAGHISHYRMAGRIQFRRADLEEYIETLRAESVSDADLRRGRAS